MVILDLNDLTSLKKNIGPPKNKNKSFGPQKKKNYLENKFKKKLRNHATLKKRRE